MYLSALLDDVTGTEEIVRLRQDFCKINDCIASVNPDNVNRYFTGSKAEGLYLPGSDYDFMYDINEIHDIEVSESLQDLVRSTRRNRLLIITDNVPPAFVMLKCITLQHPLLLRSAVHMNNEWYLSSQQVVSSHWLESNKTEAKTEVPRDVRNSKVQKQDKFRRYWSQHKNTCKSESGTGPGVRRSKRPLLACRTRCKCSMETSRN